MKFDILLFSHLIAQDVKLRHSSSAHHSSYHKIMDTAAVARESSDDQIEHRQQIGDSQTEHLNRGELAEIARQGKGSNMPRFPRQQLDGDAPHRG